MMMMLSTLTFLLSTLISSEASLWSYKGDSSPEFWSEHFPICGGDSQSPINLASDSPLTTYPTLDLSDYFVLGKKIKGYFENNGHSMQFNPDEDQKFTISGGPLDGEYQFAQLHFHWGSDNGKGSEHTVDGSSFPLEMHMVHTNTKYNGTEWKNHKDGLAVIGIFADIGHLNSRFLKPVAHAARELAKNSTATVHISLNLRKLVKSLDLDYYTYQGSLTTPGCNEIVTWIVLETPIKISKKQLKALRSLTDGHGDPLVNNFRPTQYINGRSVFHVIN